MGQILAPVAGNPQNGGPQRCAWRGLHGAELPSWEPTGVAPCPHPAVPHVSPLSPGGREEPAAPPKPSPSLLHVPHVSPDGTEGAQEYPRVLPWHYLRTPGPPRPPLPWPLPWPGLSPVALSHPPQACPHYCPQAGVTTGAPGTPPLLFHHPALLHWPKSPLRGLAMPCFAAGPTSWWGEK